MFEQYALFNILFNLVSGIDRMIYDTDLRFDKFDDTKYWFAKGYQNHYHHPGYYEDLVCPDEGYGLDVSKSHNGNSVNMKTVRPGYRDYYFIGPKHYDRNQRFSRRHKHRLQRSRKLQNKQ